MVQVRYKTYTDMHMHMYLGWLGDVNVHQAITLCFRVCLESEYCSLVTNELCVCACACGHCNHK